MRVLAVGEAFNAGFANWEAVIGSLIRPGWGGVAGVDVSAVNLHERHKAGVLSLFGNIEYCNTTDDSTATPRAMQSLIRSARNLVEFLLEFSELSLPPKAAPPPGTVGERDDLLGHLPHLVELKLLHELPASVQFPSSPTMRSGSHRRSRSGGLGASSK